MTDPTDKVSPDRQARRAKNRARLAGMTDSEVQDEYVHYDSELDRITNGRGDEAYLKANSLRAAWEELGRRGLQRRSP